MQRAEQRASSRSAFAQRFFATRPRTESLIVVLRPLLTPKRRTKGAVHEITLPAAPPLLQHRTSAKPTRRRKWNHWHAAPRCSLFRTWTTSRGRCTTTPPPRPLAPRWPALPHLVGRMIVVQLGRRLFARIRTCWTTTPSVARSGWTTPLTALLDGPWRVVKSMKRRMALPDVLCGSVIPSEQRLLGRAWSAFDKSLCPSIPVSVDSAELADAASPNSSFTPRLSRLYLLGLLHPRFSRCGLPRSA